MLAQNTAFTVKLLAFRLLTAIFIFSSLSTQSRAQFIPGYQVSIKFPQVADRGAPARTAPGGRRGGCDLDYLKPETTTSETSEENTRIIELTPITPENNIITSVSPNPAVYVHSLIIDKPVKFLVFERNTKKEVYTTKFTLPSEPGIAKVKLPETVKLQPNKTYVWQFIVICDAEQRDADVLAEGWLEKKDLTSEQKLKIEQLQQNSMAQAQLYADYGIWNEALEFLASWQENLQLKSEWDELLNSVELEKLANYPVNNCCQVANFPIAPLTTNHTPITQPSYTQNTGW